MGADTYTVRCETFDKASLKANIGYKDSSKEPSSLEVNNENHWASLQVNTADIDSMRLPEEGIYKPQWIWERPAGHAVRGINAFKLQCHVNSLHEPAVTVIGNLKQLPLLSPTSSLKV